MSYSGSTATTPNPPVCLVPNMSMPGAANSTSIYQRSKQLWFYNTSDGSTNLMDASYFTDGKALGMRPGDVLIAVCAATQSSTDHVTVIGALITTVSSTGNGMRLSTGGALTSTFG